MTNKTHQPDCNRFIRYLMGQTRDGKPPLVEYLVDEVVMRPILEEKFGRAWVAPGEDRQSQSAYLDNFIYFWYRMGYDFVRFEEDLGFTYNQIYAQDPAPRSQKLRAWADQHHGIIMSWSDFEQYPWPRVADYDFFPYEYINSHLPEGMGFVVSHAAGVFEHLSHMMSYEGLCLALHDQPDLVQAMADKIGERMVEFYTHLLNLDRVIALFPGDDIGFRSSTLVAPEQLRRFVFPWHKRFAAMAHSRCLPYFVHSCGNLERVYEDLIEDVGIDGKHSFEDAILPVEDFQKRYGGRVAALGGVDIHVLSTGTPQQVRERTRFLVETCGARGRFAIGSWNSIPSYIPVENYLAMIDEALL